MVIAIKNLIGFLILIFLWSYLWANWNQVKLIISIDPLTVLFIVFLFVLGTLNNSRVSQLFLRHIKKPATFFDMVILQNATRLINYLPMKIGTLFRVNYLRRRFGVEYSKTVNIIIHQTLLTIFWAGMLGVVCIFDLRDLVRDSNWYLIFFIFAISVVVALISLFVPISEIKINNRVVSAINVLLREKKHLVAVPLFNIIISLHILVAFILTAIRFLIIYESLGYRLTSAGAILLGVIGFCSAIWGLTPGGLGVREVLLSSFSAMTGIPLQVGVLAAMIDRAVILIWVFTFGLGCTLKLWHQYSIDLKTSEATCLSSRDSNDEIKVEGNNYRE